MCTAKYGMKMVIPLLHFLEWCSFRDCCFIFIPLSKLSKKIDKTKQVSNQIFNFWNNISCFFRSTGKRWYHSARFNRFATKSGRMYGHTRAATLTNRYKSAKTQQHWTYFQQFTMFCMKGSRNLSYCLFVYRNDG